MIKCTRTYLKEIREEEAKNIEHFIEAIGNYNRYLSETTEEGYISFDNMIFLNKKTGKICYVDPKEITITDKSIVE